MWIEPTICKFVKGNIQKMSAWKIQPSSKATEKEWKAKRETNHPTSTIKENTDQITH